MEFVQWLARKTSEGAVVLALLASAFVVGCGGPSPDPQAKVFPVKGEVKLNGQPLAKAQVTFFAKGKSPKGKPLPGARAITDSEGKYELTTYEPGDGAAAGDYAVTITYNPNVVTDSQGDKVPGPNLLAPKYSELAKSELSAKVEAAPTTVPAFELRQELSGNASAPNKAADAAPAGQGAPPAGQPPRRPIGSD